MIKLLQCNLLRLRILVAVMHRCFDRFLQHKTLYRLYYWTQRQFVRTEKFIGDIDNNEVFYNDAPALQSLKMPCVITSRMNLIHVI